MLIVVWLATLRTYFKIHGYSLGYKSGKGTVNQVGDGSTNEVIVDLVALISQTQYQHLLSILSNQVQVPIKISSEQVDSSTSAGILLSATFNYHNNACWIIDSGAIVYVNHDLIQFSTYAELPSSQVILPNQTRVPIIGVGSVTLSNTFTLRNVFYILTFTNNLISV